MTAVESVTPDLVAYLGRLATMAGVLVSIGALAVLLYLLRGTTAEARFLLKTIRRGALVLALGVVAEVFAQTAAETGSWSAAFSREAVAGALSGRFGLAAALRLLGAFGLATGCQFRRVPLGHDDSGSILARLPELGPLAASPDKTEITNHPPLTMEGGSSTSLTPMLFRWSVSASGLGAVLGVIALVGAAVIDGHTLHGSAPLVSAVATVAHLLAGSIWVGGVVALVGLLARRFRSHRRAEAADLAVRYSVLASVSLVAVGAAGLALTLVGSDSIGDLWSTDWGRLVLAKLILVAVAGLFGAVNHFLLVPRLAAQSRSIEIGVRLRQVISAEIALLGLVVVLSAQLVSTAL